MDPDVILQTDGLCKDFAGFTAVKGVNLRIKRHDVHALIGPNGAGKTTCFNMLTKFVTPSSGAIFYEGEDITTRKPAYIARRGLVRSFQISAVFPHISALGNVRVALQRKHRLDFQFWTGKRRLARLDDEAMALLTDVGLDEFRHLAAVELPYGRKRALEIATTLALDPQLLLLDEPTAGMGHEDIGRITQLISRVARNRTVLMVEHNLQVVSELANRITVLRRGEVLVEGTYQEVSSNPDVIEAYIGVHDG